MFPTGRGQWCIPLFEKTETCNQGTFSGTRKGCRPHSANALSHKIVAHLGSLKSEDGWYVPQNYFCQLFTVTMWEYEVLLMSTFLLKSLVLLVLQEFFLKEINLILSHACGSWLPWTITTTGNEGAHTWYRAKYKHKHKYKKIQQQLMEWMVRTPAQLLYDWYLVIINGNQEAKMQKANVNLNS